MDQCEGKVLVLWASFACPDIGHWHDGRFSMARCANTLSILFFQMVTSSCYQASSSTYSKRRLHKYGLTWVHVQLYNISQDVGLLVLRFSGHFMYYITGVEVQGRTNHVKFHHMKYYPHLLPMITFMCTLKVKQQHCLDGWGKTMMIQFKFWMLNIKINLK